MPAYRPRRSSKRWTEQAPEYVLACYDNGDKFTDENCSYTGCPVDEYAGHDFWLTRNEHGAGFWDGDWIEPIATELTAAAKAAGSRDLYVGDDGQIYVM